MPTIEVKLGSRGYPIVIETGLLDDAERLAGLLDERCPTKAKTVVVSQEGIWRLLGDKLSQALGADRLALLTVPDGEEAKSIAGYTGLITQMLGHGTTRDSRLIAFGGGVVGDLAGFAAATYMRGIDYVQIPTTLLAQVDSSVGGKTAINHELAKNCIGAFKQPRAVIIDPASLASLDARQLRAGAAEIIKYACIGDVGFFAWLEGNLGGLLDGSPEELAYAIETSCRAKAGIVAADEHDTSGQRALLNLGHSFGHALEKIGHFNQWLHGEAVACGMVMAAQLSCERGMLGAKERDSIRALIDSAGLPARCPPDTDAAQMLEAMRLDKKNTADSIKLILLQGIGRACLDSIDADGLLDFIGRFIAKPG